MALAYNQYLGDGSTRNFSLSFPYISRDHVQVKVNGNPVPFTWLSVSTVQLNTTPAVNAIIDIRRVTPRDRLLVDFKDASTLVETDLDLSALQTFYLSQEAFDLGEASLGVTEDGSFSALNRRISNVLDPVQPMDVVNKRWAETAMGSQLQLANAARAAAQQAEANANAHKAAAQTAQTGAETARTGAETARAGAETARDSASGHRLNAQNAQAAAEAARDVTIAARDTAVTKASEAAASAAAAATFDPATFYTKVEVDQKLAPFGTMGKRNLFVSATQPTGAVEGDIWFKI